MATSAKKSASQSTAKKAKKPATKKTATKASVAAKAKTESKKTEAKVVSVDTKKKTTRKELTPMEKLRSLNISIFISYVLLAIVSVILIGQASAEWFLSIQTRDLFANVDGVVLGSANEVLFNVEYRYILIISLLVGAIGSLLMASKLRKRYETSVTAGVSGIRWLFVGVSAALIAELVTFMGGVQDIMTLKLVAGLVILASILGWLSDRENLGAKSPRKLAFYSSMFAYFLALLPLIGSLIGTTLYGDQRFGWQVYALSAVLLLGFVATLVTQNSSIKNKAKLEYIVFEQRYLRIDQVVKFLVVLVLLASIK